MISEHYVRKYINILYLLPLPSVSKFPICKKHKKEYRTNSINVREKKDRHNPLNVTPTWDDCETQLEQFFILTHAKKFYCTITLLHTSGRTRRESEGTSLELWMNGRKKKRLTVIKARTCVRFYNINNTIVISDVWWRSKSLFATSRGSALEIVAAGLCIPIQIK